MVKNEKKCIEEYKYFWNCYEAENIGDNENPIYSCTKCSESEVIIDEGNRINCQGRYNYNLQYCLKGTKEYINNNDNYKCTECVPNAHLNNESELNVILIHFIVIVYIGVINVMIVVMVILDVLQKKDANIFMKMIN
jgi:Zn finger protein HypA/HybF involved in hydrogenase expression